MEQYIKKSALVAEIEKLYNGEIDTYTRNILDRLKSNIGTLEVKEVDEQKERMSECPYRQVRCAMYDGNIFECKGACNWVMDYLKLKGLEEQKESKV